MRTDEALRLILSELRRARSVHASLDSHHEAWAVIHEEIEEFVAAPDAKAEATEAAQVGAVAFRWLEDLFGDDVGRSIEAALPMVRELKRLGADWYEWFKTADDGVWKRVKTNEEVLLHEDVRRLAAIAIKVLTQMKGITP